MTDRSESLSAQDLTARLASLALENVRQAEQVRDLSELIHAISHDLRSPLSVVAGFSQMLASRPAITDDAKAQHFVQRVQLGIGHMEQSVQAMIDIGRVITAPLQRQPLDLSALARNILDDCAKRDPQRKTVLSIDPGMQPTGDVALVRQLLECLLDNAWKFSAPMAQTEIHVGHQQHSGSTTVYFVQDKGVGFHGEDAARMFKTFRQLHPAGRFAGIGAGLVLAGRIVSRHAGRIWATAQPMQGTTCFFTLD
jgi:light-regulated signal transduction histidine kinase (bacteriophytochrome)